MNLITRLDNEVDINLKLSINLNFYVIFLLLSFSILIGTERVICFSVFSPNYLICPSNSLANSSIMKSFLNHYEKTTENVMRSFSIFSSKMATISYFMIFLTVIIIFSCIYSNVIAKLSL